LGKRKRKSLEGERKKYNAPTPVMSLGEEKRAEGVGGGPAQKWKKKEEKKKKRAETIYLGRRMGIAASI